MEQHENTLSEAASSAVSKRLIARIQRLQAQQRWEQIKHESQQWLMTCYNDSINVDAAQIHKFYIEALQHVGGQAVPFSAYGLVYQQSKPVAIAPNALLCCTVVRNERLRLPYFLKYYREKGVDHFLFVDNDSTDETLAYLTAQSDVFVWHSRYPFKRANFGSAWFEVLLQRYGIGHWVLTVDADELLYYPACEQQSLSDFCEQLAAQGAEAYGAILLDMYADVPIKETHYQAGQDFLTCCPFFDRQFYHKQGDDLFGPFQNQVGYWGGVRRRVFGGDQWHYCLNKVPLLKYRHECVLVGGQHAVSYPMEKISAQRGGLLHFKFFSTFVEYAAAEAARAEHADEGFEYSRYARALASQPKLTLYSPGQSVRISSSAQLVNMGVMIGPKQTQTWPRNPQTQTPQARAIQSRTLTGRTVSNWIYRLSQRLLNISRAVFKR